MQDVCTVHQIRVAIDHPSSSSSSGSGANRVDVDAQQERSKDDRENLSSWEEESNTVAQGSRARQDTGEDDGGERAIYRDCHR